MTSDAKRLKRRWYDAGSLLRQLDPKEFMRQLEALEAVACVSAMTPDDRKVLLKRQSPMRVN